MKKAILPGSDEPLASQDAKAQSNRDMVWNLVISLDNSLIKKDINRIQSLLTEDFIGTIPSGQAFSKNQYIQFHCKKDEGLVSIVEKGEDSIRLYGTTAVVNRCVHVTKRSPDGLLNNFDVQRIEVCVQLKGIWYLAAGQGTQVLR